jgi:hypothetical protein
MKKTLIALAALGVVGAASAQATVSGDISYGHRSSKSNADVVTKGFGARTGNITFSVSEDLGGGLSVSGSMGIDGVNGDRTITGNSASLKVAGSFGTLALNAGEESCNGVVGQAGGVNLEDINIGFACAAGAAGTTGHSDNFTYTTPAMGAFTATILVGDDTHGYGSGAKNATVFYVNYADGPIKAGVNWTDYSGNLATFSNRTRATLSYDTGMAVLSTGYSTGGVANGTNKNKQTVFGLSIPMGATTVGIGYAKDDDTNVTKASGINVTYALSKTTSLTLNHASASGTISSGENKSDTQIFLKKVF